MSFLVNCSHAIQLKCSMKMSLRSTGTLSMEISRLAERYHLSNQVVFIPIKHQFVCRHKIRWLVTNSSSKSIWGLRNTILLAVDKKDIPWKCTETQAFAILSSFNQQITAQFQFHVDFDASLLEQILCSIRYKTAIDYPREY